MNIESRLKYEIDGTIHLYFHIFYPPFIGRRYTGNPVSRGHGRDPGAFGEEISLSLLPKRTFQTHRPCPLL